LVELQRRFIGQSVSPIPFYALIVVPLAWLTFSATVFAINFKRVMGYE
ncbi:MAG: ABC-type multidrug transport system, permease component, partial [Thermotogales bacterium 46_20]